VVSQGHVAVKVYGSQVEQGYSVGGACVEQEGQ
jgi:hypothetical protein